MKWIVWALFTVACAVVWTILSLLGAPGWAFGVIGALIGITSAVVARTTRRLTARTVHK